MIRNMIKEGKIVPAEVTVKLLEKAMKESDNDKFLIDHGFPRYNLDNRLCFETGKFRLLSWQFSDLQFIGDKRKDLRRILIRT